MTYIYVYMYIKDFLSTYRYVKMLAIEILYNYDELKHLSLTLFAGTLRFYLSKKKIVSNSDRLLANT